MKEIKKEVVETKVTGYEASDGTVFSSKEECLIYEDTAKCAIKTMVKGLQIGACSEWSLFETGCDDYVEIYKINTAEDMKLLIQYVTMMSGREFDKICRVLEGGQYGDGLKDPTYFIGKEVCLATGYCGDFDWCAMYNYDECLDRLRGIYKNITTKEGDDVE